MEAKIEAEIRKGGWVKYCWSQLVGWMMSCELGGDGVWKVNMRWRKRIGMRDEGQ